MVVLLPIIDAEDSATVEGCNSWATCVEFDVSKGRRMCLCIKEISYCVKIFRLKNYEIANFQRKGSAMLTSMSFAFHIFNIVLVDVGVLLDSSIIERILSWLYN
jgi:hypothetical protein